MKIAQHLKRHTCCVAVLCIGSIGFGVGCAGTQTPATEAPSEAVAGPKVEVKEVDVSVQAQETFKATVERYKMNKRGVGLSQAECAALTGAFAEAYDRYPKLIDAKFNEAVIHEYCGNVGAAQSIYRDLIADHPDYGPALNNLGRLLSLEGQQEQAQQYFEKAAANKDSAGYTNVALSQREAALDGKDKQVLADAIRNVQRALAVNSANIEAYTLLATLLYDHAQNKSQLEMARLVCVQATKVDAEFGPIYNMLGLILLRLEEVTSALAEFRKAVALNANDKEALMNIGAVTLSFRDYKSAEESFAKVLTLAPAKKMEVAATIGLGVAHRGQRRYDKALEMYQRARELAPNRVSVLYNIGILLQDYTFDASDPAKAIGQLEQARGLLNQFALSSNRKDKVNDAQRRIKNIDEMLPMLREQQEMMRQMQTQPPAAQ